MEDDLTSTPHNIYVRIQYGGLLGLQVKNKTPDVVEGRIADIYGLVDTATDGGERIDDLAYADLRRFMLEQQTKRRRARKR